MLVRQGGWLDGDLPEGPTTSDSEGRFVRVDLTVLRTRLSVCCVYGPNSGRAAFFEELRSSHKLPDAGDGGITLLGGDFNCICGDRDQDNNTQSRFEGADALGELMRDRGLVDAYRTLHPLGSETTHWGTAGGSSARLDRWLVSQRVCDEGWLQSLQHIPSWEDGGPPGDHSAVVLTLKPPGLPTIGPGQCSFPLHVLADAAALTELRKRTLSFLQTTDIGGGDRPNYDRWLLLKDALLSTGYYLAKGIRSAAERRAFLAVASATAAAAAAARWGAAKPAPADQQPQTGNEGAGGTTAFFFCDSRYKRDKRADEDEDEDEKNASRR